MIKKFIPKEKQKDINFEEYAKKLEGYSGSDIRLVCKEALMKGVRRTILILESMNDKSNSNLNVGKIEAILVDLIGNKDMEEAINTTKPASINEMNQYLKWMEKFGSF